MIKKCNLRSLLSRTAILPALVFLMLTGGCASYRLGSMLPSSIQTVYMPTVINTTSEPLLENEVTTAILSELQRDGSLTLATEGEADAILSVRLTEYNLAPLSYASDNRTQPDEYQIRIRAEIELVERVSGKTLVRSANLTGEDEVPLSGNLTQAKRVGLPGAADDLARVIVAAVTEAWVEGL